MAPRGGARYGIVKREVDRTAMDVSNRYYGHDHVLARYCGLASPRPIRGEVQHGWNSTYGLVEVGGAAKRTALPRFVWNRRNLDWCRREGIRDVEAIGAPFLYHPHEEAAAAPGSLLVCPFHGWEKGPVLGSFRAYVDALEEIRGRFREVTVCLYWLEYANPDVHRLYQDAGYRVVTNGHRDGNPGFVAALSRHLAGHEYVTSNRIATIAFCALYLGRKFFLYGPPMSADEEQGGLAARNLAFEREAFDLLRYERFGDACHVEIGRTELGDEFKRSPAELRHLLGWDYLGIPTWIARARRRIGI